MQTSGIVISVTLGVQIRLKSVPFVEPQNHSHQNKMTKRAKKRAKKGVKKKPSLPVIKRRLFRLVSQICRDRADHTCEVCGMKKGDIYNGKPQRVEAHHLFSRSIKNSPMKWDMNNLICLCTLHHKTGPQSAHKNPIWFGEWLRTNKPEQYQYVLDHYEDEVNLNSRSVLEDIERKLKELNNSKEIKNGSR